MRNRLAPAAWIVTAAAIASLTLAETCPAQPGLRPGQFMIWPSGSLAFPTGRFAEEDLDTASLKIGLTSSGYKAALDLGYVLSENAVVGLAFGYSRFDFDLSPEIRAVYAERDIVIADGYSSAIQVQAWLRYFLPRPFPYWQPYLVAGAGVGRPKGTIEYAGPTQLGALSVTDQESIVNLSASMTAGLGALVPVTSSVGFCVETRYNRISSKGAARTDKFTLDDGSTVEVKYGEEEGDEFRLKAKSNTEWWEIRGGIVFILK